MARGDAIFARCNVDWPNDPRCELLPNNDTRWLNHLMWLWCTKHRSPELPAHYTVDYMAKAASITPAKTQKALRAMAELELIACSPQGSLVVHGVTRQNSRLEWKYTEIEDCENPWKTDPNYLHTNGVPAMPRNAPNRKGKEQGKEHRKREQSLTFAGFWKISPRIGSKEKAEYEWKRLEDEERELAMAAIVEQIQIRADWQKVDPKKFIREWKDMERWLKDKRWTDDLERPKIIRASQNYRGGTPFDHD